MKPLCAEQILVVLSGVLLAGCDKSGTTPKPEPAQPATVTSPSGAASAVNAKEVPAAAASASAKKGGKEMGCAPGGCAPGKCGGKE